MFYNCPNLSAVYGLETISNTRNVNSMESMFEGCSSLLSSDCGNCYSDSYYFEQISMDITNFDTYNVTNMDKMFKGCSSLTSLDFSNWCMQRINSESTSFAEGAGFSERPNWGSSDNC